MNKKKMRHPVIYGQDEADAPDYITLSQGTLIEDNQYPSCITHEPGRHLTGCIYWQGRGRGSTPDSLRFDAYTQTFKATIYQKDGTTTKIDCEYENLEVSGGRVWIRGSEPLDMESPGDREEVVRYLIIDQKLGECILLQYPKTDETGAE